AAAARLARNAGRHADPIVTDLEPELVIPLRELDGDGAGTLLREPVPQRVADELVECEGDGNGRALVENGVIGLHLEPDPAVRPERVAQPLGEALDDLPGRHAAVLLMAQDVV